MLAPALDQVGARHDAQQTILVVHDRDLPPAGAHHALLEHLDRVFGADRDLPGVHNLPDGLVTHAMAHGAIDRAAGEQPDQLAAFQHGNALVPGALHLPGCLDDRFAGADGLHAHRHQRRYLDRCLHDARQQVQDLAVDVFQRPVADQRGCRAAMPPAAEVRRDLRYVHVIGRAARDELHVAVELHQHEDRARLEQLAQLVGQRRDLVDRLLSVGSRQHDRMPVDGERLGIFEQLLVQRALLGHQPVLEKLAHDVQIGAAFQQPRGAANIARGRRAIR